MINLSYNDMYDDNILGEEMRRKKKETWVRKHRNRAGKKDKKPSSAHPSIYFAITIYFATKFKENG